MGKKRGGSRPGGRQARTQPRRLCQPSGRPREKTAGCGDPRAWALARRGPEAAPESLQQLAAGSSASQLGSRSFPGEGPEWPICVSAVGEGLLFTTNFFI